MKLKSVRIVPGIITLLFLLFYSLTAKNASSFWIVFKLLYSKNLFSFAIKQHTFEFWVFFSSPYFEINFYLSICDSPHHAEKLSDAWSLIKYQAAAKTLLRILVTSYEAIYSR